MLYILTHTSDTLLYIRTHFNIYEFKMKEIKKLDTERKLSLILLTLHLALLT